MKNRKEELKKEAFALDPSALPDNIDVGDVVVNIIAGSSTLETLTPQTGIKAGSTEQLNILDTDVVWSTGNCVSSATGGETTIVPRNLTTTRLTDRELLCLDVLDAKLPMYMAAGANNEDFGFSDLFMQHKIAKNSYQLEKLVWQGDTAGAGNLSVTDGFLKIAAGDTGNLAYEQTYGAGDFASIANFAADPIGAVELINQNLTDALDERDDVILYMNLANYKLLAKDIRDTYGLDATGVFTNSGQENKEGFMTMTFPGTNLKVIGTHGLNGVDSIFCTYQANLRYGTDLESDKEDVMLFFDNYHREMVSDIIFSIGFQYQDPSQVLIVTA